MKIGMAGTGRMGAAIAQRLAGLGHEVKVWNRTANKARDLGLEVAGSATRLADVSETLISILTDADRKSTRLNSSHITISYAVFGLKKTKAKAEEYRLLTPEYAYLTDLKHHRADS